MKIGIFTFHCAHNYGAVLQAYALQEYLCSIGHDAYIIDYRPNYLLKEYALFPAINKRKFKLSISILLFIRDLFFFPIRLLRYIRFNAFIKKYLRLQSINLYDKDHDYDVFVFGGDQIWNPKITEGLDNVYCGDFPAAEDVMLVSYAASVGSLQNLNEEQKDYLISRLRKFDSVSVREKDVADFLYKVGVKVQVVCDPVFLSGKVIFERIARKIPNHRPPYLMFFQLSKSAISYDAFVKKIAQKFNLDYVDVISHRETVSMPLRRQCLSPEQFLAYVYYSEVVVTTSFHGAALSLLFDKKVYVIKTGSNIDERAQNLLDMFGLTDYFISITSDISLNDPIAVSHKYTELLESSKKYLSRI